MEWKDRELHISPRKFLKRKKDIVLNVFYFNKKNLIVLLKNLDLN